MIQSSYSFMWDHSDWNTLMRLSELSSHFPFSLSIASESRFAIRGSREDEKWTQGGSRGWSSGCTKWGCGGEMTEEAVWATCTLQHSSSTQCSVFQRCSLGADSLIHTESGMMSHAGPGCTRIIQCKPHTSNRLGSRETPAMGKKESPGVHLYAAIAKHSCSKTK